MIVTVTLMMTPTGVTYDAHNDINDDAYTTTHDSHLDTILHTMVSSLATMKHELRLPTDKYDSSPGLLLRCA